MYRRNFYLAVFPFHILFLSSSLEFLCVCVVYDVCNCFFGGLYIFCVITTLINSQIGKKQYNVLEKECIKYCIIFSGLRHHLYTFFDLLTRTGIICRRISKICWMITLILVLYVGRSNFQLQTFLIKSFK